VLPALIRKVFEAKLTGRKQVVVWGTGNPRRELLYNEDLADACIHLLSLPDAVYDELLVPDAPPLINIGTGNDLTIRELALLVGRVLEFEGEFVFDTSQMDGTPRKLLDVSRINALGWRASTPLEEGIRKTFVVARAQLELAVR
jgi:GDP-L-fucose synthase